jgi:cytochrome c-type biogenesis protein CcmH
VRSAACGCLLLLAMTAFAADTPHRFEDPTLQTRYAALLEELRCLVCQNQSLADSHAELAQDLRNEVFRMLNEGNDDAAIRRFMVDRYGEFVLYRPPVSALTLGLWFGPLAGLAAVTGIWWRLQRAGGDAAERTLSAEEEARLAALLPCDGTSGPPAE